MISAFSRSKATNRQEEIDSQTRDFLQKKPDCAEILSARYFDRKTFEEIGKMMFITKRYAVRKHKEALAEFQKVLDFKETGEQNHN